MDENILNIVASLIQCELNGGNSFKHIRNRARKGYPSIIPYNKEHAKYLSEMLTERELKALIRALVKYGCEAGLSKTGGSASPVVPLYWVYTRIYPEGEPTLTAWVREHSVNSYYEPGPKYTTPEEYAAQREKARLMEEERLRPIMRARYEREANKATLNLPNAIRRGDVKAVKAMIDKGGNIKQAMTQVKSLRSLAKETTKTDMHAFLGTLDIKLTQ